MKAVYANGVDVTDTPLPFGRSDQSIRDLEVVLTSRITQVVGSVTDNRGRPVVGVSVIAFSPDRDQWYPDSRFLRRATTRNDGTFAMPLPPGDYWVAAVDWTAAVVGEDGWRDPDFLESLVSRATKTPLAEGQTVAVALKAGLKR